MRSHVLACALLLLWAGRHRATGVILLDTGDPAAHTTTPGDNSGWQYEGRFGDFVGTPIAPLYFITASHIPGDLEKPFVYHGETFTTKAVYTDPATDLRIWQVDHPFADYAPLYRAGAEAGLELRVFGRGTQRGPDRILDGTLRGWDWGTSDAVQRWGSNVVAGTPTQGGISYLQANFGPPGVGGPAHLSVGDSGGGVFVLDEGLWKLAGINAGVDGLATGADGSGQFASAIFDARGYYAQDSGGDWVLVTGEAPVPTTFYSTRLSARLDWITQVTGLDPAALPTESYAAWQTLYFTPEQRVDPAVAGPLADPDGDGVSNLQEFAFNLDPTFPEPAPMTPGTGVRGLPLVQLEQTAPGETRLTVEFVRRTAASESGLTYMVQFSPSLDTGSADWQSGGTESVTLINARWERVKVMDPVAVEAAGGARFARVAAGMSNAL